MQSHRADPERTRCAQGVDETYLGQYDYANRHIDYIASEEELFLNGVPLKGTLKTTSNLSLLTRINLIKTFLNAFKPSTDGVYISAAELKRAV